MKRKQPQEQSAVARFGDLRLRWLGGFLWRLYNMWLGCLLFEIRGLRRWCRELPCGVGLQKTAALLIIALPPVLPNLQSALKRLWESGGILRSLIGRRAIHDLARFSGKIQGIVRVHMGSYASRHVGDNERVAAPSK